MRGILKHGAYGAVVVSFETEELQNILYSIFRSQRFYDYIAKPLYAERGMVFCGWYYVLNERLDVWIKNYKDFSKYIQGFSSEAVLKTHPQIFPSKETIELPVQYLRWFSTLKGIAPFPNMPYTAEGYIKYVTQKANLDIAEMYVLKKFVDRIDQIICRKEWDWFQETIILEFLLNTRAIWEPALRRDTNTKPSMTMGNSYIDHNDQVGDPEIKIHEIYPLIHKRAILRSFSATNILDKYSFDDGEYPYAADVLDEIVDRLARYGVEAIIMEPVGHNTYIHEVVYLGKKYKAKVFFWQTETGKQILEAVLKDPIIIERNDVIAIEDIPSEIENDN